MRVQFDAQGEANFVILGLGPRVEVLDPPALRDRITTDITSMYNRLRQSG
jgi:predicted DNA-binding transcriptional regulator YafY